MWKNGGTLELGPGQKKSPVDWTGLSVEILKLFYGFYPNGVPNFQAVFLLGVIGYSNQPGIKPGNKGIGEPRLNVSIVDGQIFNFTAVWQNVSEAPCTSGRVVFVGSEELFSGFGTRHKKDLVFFEWPEGGVGANHFDEGTVHAYFINVVEGHTIAEKIVP